MTTTERPGRRFGTPTAPSAPSGPPVAKRVWLWFLHSAFAWVLFPFVVGPGIVAGLARVHIGGTEPLAGAALWVSVAGFALGLGIAFAVRPRKRLFPARPGATKSGRNAR